MGGTAQEGIDRDSYLMGKRVDKAFEQFLKQQLKEEKIKRTTIDGEREADIYNKRLEDPLANIRKSEKSMKERLIANPVKMKKMKAIFEEMMQEKLAAKEEKMKKKSKKSKKPKKRKAEDSADSDSSVEADEQLEKLRRESQKSMSRHAGTGSGWNQAEIFRSSYANRLVNKGIDEQDEISTSKNITRGDESKKSSSSSKKSKKSKKSKRSESDEKEKKKQEMAKKRLAMMQNATEYQTNREKKAAEAVKKQKAEDEAERTADGARKGAAFLGDVKIQMAGGQSMEQRIRSRKGMQQRRDVDFDK